eukprot:11818370-Ditylum_brightwellii.AAC.1
MEKASGGDLFVDKEYTLLSSEACSPKRDNGAAALNKLVQAHPNASPMLPNLSPIEIAHMSLMKLNQKGDVIGDSVTVRYVAKLIDINTKEEWRMDRNARVSSLLVQSVQTGIKRKTDGTS